VTALSFLVVLELDPEERQVQKKKYAHRFSWRLQKSRKLFFAFIESEKELLYASKETVRPIMGK
jgi:hypothetical protein